MTSSYRRLSKTRCRPSGDARTVSSEFARHESSKLPLWRLPVLWLFLGPPTLQLIAARGAMASLKGNYGLWNIFETGWWLFFGLVTVRELYLERRQLNSLLRKTTYTWVWAALWLALLYLSCLVSPRSLFSLANVGLLTILVLAALDLSVKLYSGRLAFRRALKMLLGTTVGLLLLTGAVHLIAPGVVQQPHYEGFRIRGGNISYSPLLAIIALFVSFYFWRRPQDEKRWIFASTMILGLTFLVLGKTRSAYGGFLAGAALYFWQWKQLRYNAVSLLTTVALVTGITCALVLVSDMSSGASSTLRSTGSFVIRGGEGFSTLNGRTRAWHLLWEAAKDEPLGLGFSAGPRALLMSPSSIEVLYSDIWGNAHSAYVEVFSGSGYLALVAWLAIILCVVFKIPGTYRKELIPLHALLVAVLAEGALESELVLPFKQSAVLFWVIVATLLAAYARRRTYSAAVPSSKASRPPLPLSKKQVADLRGRHCTRRREDRKTTS